MRRARGVLATALAVGLAVSASGCGTKSSGEVSNQAAKALAPDVQALRLAASGKSIPAVRAAQQTLDNEVTALYSAGELSSARAQALQDAAEVLLSDYTRRNQPTTPPTTPAPTSASPSETPTTPAPIVTVTVTPSPTPSDSESESPPASPTPTDTNTPH